MIPPSPRMSAQNRKDLAPQRTDDRKPDARSGPFTEMFKDLDERLARAARAARESTPGSADPQR